MVETITFQIFHMVEAAQWNLTYKPLEWQISPPNNKYPAVLYGHFIFSSSLRTTTPPLPQLRPVQLMAAQWVVLKSEVPLYISIRTSSTAPVALYSHVVLLVLSFFARFTHSNNNGLRGTALFRHCDIFLERRLFHLRVRCQLKAVEQESRLQLLRARLQQQSCEQNASAGMIGCREMWKITHYQLSCNPYIYM